MKHERKAFDAVNPGGVLLVYDRMLGDTANLVENLVISLDMLLVTEGGCETLTDFPYATSLSAG